MATKTSDEEQNRKLRQFRRTVVQLSKTKSISNFKRHYTSFSLDVPIPGFRESVKANHWLIRLIWVILIFTGFGLTTYFVCSVVGEYLDEPTATKVKFVRKSRYEFPSVHFCLHNWENYENLLSQNMTQSAIQYLFSLILVDQARLNATEVDQGKRELEEFAHRHNYTYFIDLIKMGSWRPEQLLGPNPEALGYECLGCVAEQQLALTFAVQARRMCFKLNSPTSISSSTAGIGFKIKEPGPAATDSSNFICVSDDCEYADIMDFHSVQRGSYQIILNANRQISISSKDSPCVEKSEYIDGGEGQKYYSCYSNCQIDLYEEDFNCRLFSGTDRIFDPDRKLEICSPKTGAFIRLNETFDHDPKQSVIEPFLAKMADKCTTKCLPPCSRLMYDLTVYQTEPPYDNQTTVFFIQPKYLKMGILTYQETPTYSFQSAISNVGGQLGLWMGLSMVTIVQVLFYFANRIVGEKSNTKDEKF